MDTARIIVTIVVGLFGVASAVLGFIAELTKLTPDDIDVSISECVYPANPAFALGLCAVPLLLVNQITVSVLTGCCGCCKPRGGHTTESKRVMGIISSVFSWIAALLAIAFFLEAAWWNVPVTRESAVGCTYIKDGVFRRAAVLSLVAAALGINSYVMLRASAAAAAVAATTAPGGIVGPTPAGEPKPDGQQPPVGEIEIGQPSDQGWYGQAPYAHSRPAQGHGYGQLPPAAPAQRHALAVAV